MPTVLHPNNCLQFNYKAVDASRNYLLVCPADANLITPSNTLTPLVKKGIVIDTYVTEWNWGRNFNLNNVLSYAWSLNTGILA